VSLYLDASAILPFLIVEPSSEAVLRFLVEADAPLAVSEFAAAEVASALSRLTRVGAMDRDVAERHIVDFDTWRAAFTGDAAIEAADVRLANVFVRRFEFGLRAPDALHAAVCRRADHTLVTLDRSLASAAEALGVRVSCLA
jgi:predicted nucleic acid-binding protein